MDWLIGIDGGGTKTTGCAASLDGQILARAEKGPSNYHVTGLTSFKTVIAAIVDDLAAACRLAKKDIRAVSLGLAGADRPRDRQILAAALAELGLGCEYIISSDAKAALAAGLGKAEGIVLIAGTGSVAYGVNSQGMVIRAGGWGHIASDEGSGYAIGRQALARSLKAAEGRDRQTALLPMILRHFDLDSWDELIGYINSSATTKAQIASLTEVVAQAAGGGDGVAAEILLQAGDDLAGLVASVIDRGFDRQAIVPVCLYGSILTKVDLVRERLRAALGGRARLALSEREAVMGAVLIGLEWLRKKERATCK